MLRVWVDAALQDPALRAESAPLLDWGRRRMARYLRPRGFGDVDIEAVVMVALLGVFGARPRPRGRGRRRRAHHRARTPGPLTSQTGARVSSSDFDAIDFFRAQDL